MSPAESADKATIDGFMSPAARHRFYRSTVDGSLCCEYVLNSVHVSATAERLARNIKRHQGAGQ